MLAYRNWRRFSTGSFCLTLALALLATSVLVMPAMAKSDNKVSAVAKGKAQSGEMLQLIVAYESRPGNLERQNYDP